MGSYYYIDVETEESNSKRKSIIIDKIFDLFSSDAAMSNVYQKTEINSKEEIWIFCGFQKYSAQISQSIHQLVTMLFHGKVLFFRTEK